MSGGDNVNEWDSSLFDFDEFIEFFFGDGDAQTYGSHEVPILCQNPARIVEHMQRLFKEFGLVGRRFPLDRVDSGLWKVTGPNPNLPELLWENDVGVPQRLRIDTVRSMYHVFADFVANDTLNIGETTTSFFMWWDHICEGPWFASRLIENSTRSYERLQPQHREILDAAVETCERLLQLDDQFIAICAFHGFGHSHHPLVPAIIDRFLAAKGQEFPLKTLTWMRECREFTIM